MQEEKAIHQLDPLTSADGTEVFAVDKDQGGGLGIKTFKMSLTQISDFVNNGSVSPDFFTASGLVDIDGVPAPNITVNVLDASGTNTLESPTTDASGVYTTSALANGTYVIRVDATDTDLGGATLSSVSEYIVVINGAAVTDRDFEFTATPVNLVITANIKA